MRAELDMHLTSAPRELSKQIALIEGLPNLHDVILECRTYQMSTWSTERSVHRFTRLRSIASELARKVSGNLTLYIILDPQLDPYKKEHWYPIKNLEEVIMEAESSVHKRPQAEVGECKWRIEPLTSSWAWTRDWELPAPFMGEAYKHPGPWYVMVDEDGEIEVQLKHNGKW